VALYWGRAATSGNGLLSAFLSTNWTVFGPFKKLLTVLFNGRDIYVEINEAISLRQLVLADKDLAVTTRKVARVLRIHFRRVRTAVIGPDLSHKRVMIDRLLQTEPVRNAIAQHAKAKKISLEKSRALARKHALNIAANVSYGTIRILEILLTKLWNKIYNGVILRGIEPVRELAKDNEIVYVPCHRSHIDYLLLSYSLHNHGLNVPHIAAGENLNMPIVGSILRRGGAFFIRRSFGGDKLYTAVFNEYIHTVFTRGYPVEYFVEGGRSRTGRMRAPATGTLAMTVRSHLRDSSRPIVFIPVYIGYEKVFEGRSYLGELKGKVKKKENLFDLVKTVKQLKNYGHVFLNFGEPINLTNYLDQKMPNWRDEHENNSGKKPKWLTPVVNELATDVMDRINQTAAVSGMSICAICLLSAKKHAMAQSELEQAIDHFLELLRDAPYSKLATLPKISGQKLLENTLKLNKFDVSEDSFGKIITLKSQNAMALTYYRNNILHLFALPGLIAAIVFANKSLSKPQILLLVAA
jgi:glycerol-3-phosphate O-acyltransferase